jgi:large subunit ribosomal protein L5
MAIKERYLEVQKQLKESKGLKNIFEVPRIKKIVINVGAGRLKDNPKLGEDLQKALMAISGQKPLVCTAKKAVASFKIRRGHPVGYKVTLRGRRMFDFLERLIATAMPRIRDFRGLKESAVDSFGNLHIGIRDLSIFPEVTLSGLNLSHGLEISIVCQAKNRELAKEFFKRLGIPFKG